MILVCTTVRLNCHVFMHTTLLEINDIIDDINNINNITNDIGQLCHKADDLLVGFYRDMIQ